MKISEIVEKTGLESLNSYDDAEVPEVYVSDMASDVITGAKAGSMLVTTMVRAGRATYFIDVKEAKNGQRFIALSENKLDADDKRQRSTIRVFGESIEEFKQAVEEAASAAIQ